MPATVPAASRARITNGHLPTGIDGRTLTARRFRDVLRDFLAQAEGNQDDLDESRRVALRTAAALSVQIEQIEHKFLAGEADLLDDRYHRLVRARRRALEAGMYKATAPDTSGDLQEHLRKMAEKKARKSRKNGKAKATTRLQLDEDDDDGN